MDWQDEGIILAMRPYGETSSVVTVLTPGHGRHAGLVRGARLARLRGLYQPGNQVCVHWKGRLSEHLGTFGCELRHCVSAQLMEEPEALFALASACAVADVALPEREPQETIYAAFQALIHALETGGGSEAYVRWECHLLTDLGFGLDLSCCAVTGTMRDLIYVSPKTGRAVSRLAGAAYHDKLLALPAFLIPRESATRQDEPGNPHPDSCLSSPPPSLDDLLVGLRMTGYFLDRYVFSLKGRPGQEPAARHWLMDRLRAHIKA